jgi:hypothetical protein
MTINIEFANHLDVRDLGEIADTEYDLVNDREADHGDGRRLESALETLDALQSMLRDLGMGYVPYPEVADTLRGLAVTTNPTLYAAGFFVEAMKEYVEEIGDLPSDLPSYIVIDWEATAAGLREGYSAVYLDGKEYLIRRS